MSPAAPVVVVGSGIAGLTAALHARAAGARVVVVTKDVLDHANTRFAQGGIAGVVFDDDRTADHLADTLAAGAGLCDPEAARVLVEEGPDRIRELVALGVAFDRDAEGAFVRGLEAAHSYPRILHAGGDATGTAIEAALVRAVREAGIEVVEHAFLADVIVAVPAPSATVPAPSATVPTPPPTVPTPRVGGVELLVGTERRMLDAAAVVLATGGAGQLYSRTTNPPVATGDGIAAAIRAGASVRDLEFVQFHPTVLAAGEPFLISEAVRGEGAVLRDAAGRRFALDAHPDGELAPRDVVARAIARAMRAQGGAPVTLDATGIGSADADERARFLAARFPTIDAELRARGIDWARARVPVTPAAHYLMGGVAVDLDGRTDVAGLLAVGEVARTGVHGANRLASNSLLEGAVFGARAGAAAAAHAAGAPADRTGTPGDETGTVADGAGTPGDKTGTVGGGTGTVADGTFTRRRLQELMWERAGLERDEEGLREAASVIAAWRAARGDARTVAELEDANLLLVAERLVAAARARRESVGAHHRSDAPAGGTALGRAGGAATRRREPASAADRRSPAAAARPAARTAVSPC